MYDRTITDVIGERFIIDLGGAKLVINHLDMGKQTVTLSRISLLFKIINEKLNINVEGFTFYKKAETEMTLTQCLIQLCNEIWDIGKLEGKWLWMPFRKKYLLNKFKRKALNNHMIIVSECINLMNFWTFLGKLLSLLGKGITPQQRLGDKSIWLLWKQGFLGLNLRECQFS